MIKAYYAILLFVCLGVKPFYTIGYVSYYELNIDYIVEKYCVNKSKPQFKCNGKCHLAKKLSLTSTLKTKSTEQSISSSLHEAFFPVYYEVAYKAFSTVRFQERLPSLCFFKDKEYNISLAIPSPPPQC